MMISRLNFSLHLFINLLILLGEEDTYLPKHACGIKMTACKNRLSPSTSWFWESNCSYWVGQQMPLVY